MTSADANDLPAGLPDGYVAIPVSADQIHTPLRICALVRREPDPIGGHLAMLRDHIDARVFLGCVLDSGSRVQRWVEIWVQDLDSISTTVTACREALSNRVLDERWTHQFQVMDALDAGGVVRTGWETAHPLPTFLDLSTLEPVHPDDPVVEENWTLCRDDALLTKMGLPAYSSTLHRYLFLPKEGEQTTFVPVTPDAPTNTNTRSMDDMLREHRGVVPLNASGGLMLVREYNAVGYEEFSDLLSGATWEGELHGRTAIPSGVTPKELNEADPALPLGGRVFLGEHGRWGRIIETFHLKLRLLADAIGGVRSVAEEHQRPLLNLSADSFQIELGRPGHGLPFLWTARSVLSNPGDAISLPIVASDARYYLRAGSAGTSVYRPASAGAPIRGRGTVRIREVVLGTREQSILEGTFDTQEKLEAGHMDLLWLRVNLGHDRMDLYGYLDPESALATGEIRFRTIGQRLEERQIAALKAAAGVPLRNTPFEIVPLLSTPCDLYSLGVLAVRTLLVDNKTSLPVSLDEVLSLAHQVAVDHDGTTDLATRIRRLFDTDKRWVLSLGPQRLTYEDVAPEDAFDLVPTDLWWDTLAMVVRTFPGVGPDSTCRDLGDAPVGGPHKVFDRALSDLESLLLRTRSLIVIDWRFNREIYAVIRGHVGGSPDGSEAGGPA